MSLADLETAKPAEAVRRQFHHRTLSTVNRYLAELRFITN